MGIKVAICGAVLVLFALLLANGCLFGDSGESIVKADEDSVMGVFIAPSQRRGQLKRIASS